MYEFQHFYLEIFLHFYFNIYSLNRLVEESHQLGVDITAISYGYDENSNLLSRATEAPDASLYEYYTYNELDQLLKQTGTKGQILYRYDENGSMIEKKSGGKTERQTYDALDRLAAWTDGESKAAYTYNSANKRSGKTVDGITTEHIWIGEEIQLDKTQGERISYIHGIQLIASDYGEYLYNAHGDVVQLIEGNQVIQWYDYDAYGQIRNQKAEDESDHNPYRYAGEYRDKETKYVYLRGRYYDPEISRFINVDPMRDGLNWYGYAGGNPVKYHDPSGYALETILDVVGLGFSIYDMVTEPSWKNAAFLVWDVASIILPFVPGSYVGKGSKVMKAVSKVASKVDDAIDIGKVVVKKVAKGIVKGLSKADDVGDFVKGTIKLESKTGLLGKSLETINRVMKIDEARGYAERVYAGISGAINQKGNTPNFIGQDGDVPVHANQQDMIKSITDGGAVSVGPTTGTTETGEIFRMDQVDSNKRYQIDIRVMPGQGSSAGSYRGPRTITTIANTMEYVFQSGRKVVGDVAKTIRKGIGHLHGQF